MSSYHTIRGLAVVSLVVNSFGLALTLLAYLMDGIGAEFAATMAAFFSVLMILTVTVYAIYVMEQTTLERIEP